MTRFSRTPAGSRQGNYYSPRGSVLSLTRLTWSTCQAYCGTATCTVTESQYWFQQDGIQDITVLLIHLTCFLLICMSGCRSLFLYAEGNLLPFINWRLSRNFLCSQHRWEKSEKIAALYTAPLWSCVEPTRRPLQALRQSINDKTYRIWIFTFTHQIVNYVFFRKHLSYYHLWWIILYIPIM